MLLSPCKTFLPQDSQQQLLTWLTGLKTEFTKSSLHCSITCVIFPLIS
jgi:hypothetical protein